MYVPEEYLDIFLQVFDAKNVIEGSPPNPAHKFIWNGNHIWTTIAIHGYDVNSTNIKEVRQYWEHTLNEFVEEEKETNAAEDQSQETSS